LNAKAKSFCVVLFSEIEKFWHGISPSFHPVFSQFFSREDSFFSCEFFVVQTVIQMFFARYLDVIWK